MIVAETWLGAALDRVWCAREGKRGINFYLLCLTMGGRPRYLASNGTRLVGTDLQVEVSTVDARREKKGTRQSLDATSRSTQEKRCRLNIEFPGVGYVFGFGIPCRETSRYVSSWDSTDQAWVTAE